MDCSAFTSSVIKHKGICYIQSPDKVHKLLDVERYVRLWPQIPLKELHASSVEHPEHPEWRWLLHTRRVPLLSESRQGHVSLVNNAPQGRPSCAGVGDPDGVVWVCWDCLLSLAQKKPHMPLMLWLIIIGSGGKKSTSAKRPSPRKCLAL